MLETATSAVTDRTIFTLEERQAALAAFHATPSHRDRPNRYWKLDLDTVDFGVQPSAEFGGNSVAFEYAAKPGLIVCDLASAARDHRELVTRALAQASIEKFALLCRAYNTVGALIHVSAEVEVADPITVRYHANAGANCFPLTLVILEAGARATVIEQFEAAGPTLICTSAELLAGESAHLRFVAPQELPSGSRVFATRTFHPQRNAQVSFVGADLGAQLAVGSVDMLIEAPGVHAELDALFFAGGSEHIDLVTRIGHRVGHSTSRTTVKSIANGHAQGRYLGSIAIAKDAQGTEASLRDDALLLSQNAHIDSIPALEIAANDVKAFHGATVGAIDEEQLFYIASRGIPREEGERMIALGFFDPLIERFPTERLREHLRSRLQAKIR